MIDQTLYFTSISSRHPMWQKLYKEVDRGGKFFLNVYNRIDPQRFSSRDESVWSTPWKMTPPDKFKMIAYDPTFNKTYEEVSDERAREVKVGIQSGKKYCLMYSGGMDSTSVVVSLLKNLTEEELESFAICASIHSVLENPNFWRNHIFGKLKIFDSNAHLYDDYINMGYTPITADEGDCIFGTHIGLQLYHNYEYFVGLQAPAVQNNLMKLKYKVSDGDVHYSAYKDIIISFLAFDDTPEGQEFGRLLYEKYHYNVLTTKVPVNSLHDFFWWLIFNVKYLNCSIRGAIYFNRTIPLENCLNSMVHWFNGAGFQQWSMNNNNNGLKIRNTLASYKYVQRKYIYEFDKNEWYFNFKTKLESMSNLNIRGKNLPMKPLSNNIIAVNDKFEYLCVAHEENGILEKYDYKGVVRSGKEIREYFEEGVRNFKIDWTD